MTDIKYTMQKKIKIKDVINWRFVASTIHMAV